ncbi:MAG TPA: hypothetical protein VLA04_04675 [Verrucomicrobiae bacterium]|nr:hypothetical protein [Verrucomicrobiae bacterium]
MDVNYMTDCLARVPTRAERSVVRYLVRVLRTSVSREKCQKRRIVRSPMAPSLLETGLGDPRFLTLIDEYTLAVDNRLLVFPPAEGQLEFVRVSERYDVFQAERTGSFFCLKEEDLSLARLWMENAWMTGDANFLAEVLHCFFAPHLAALDQDFTVMHPREKQVPSLRSLVQTTGDPTVPTYRITEVVPPGVTLEWLITTLATMATVAVPQAHPRKMVPVLVGT